VRLTELASAAGFELEQNFFVPVTVTVSFKDADDLEVARVTRQLDALYSARLFAVNCFTPMIASMEVKVPLEARGFAIAQVRADTIAGEASSEDPSTQLQTVLPQDTISNTGSR
jgi:hypothetical protein